MQLFEQPIHCCVDICYLLVTSQPTSFICLKPPAGHKGHWSLMLVTLISPKFCGVPNGFIPVPGVRCRDTGRHGLRGVTTGMFCTLN